MLMIIIDSDNGARDDDNYDDGDCYCDTDDNDSDDCDDYDCDYGAVDGGDGDRDNYNNDNDDNDNDDDNDNNDNDNDNNDIDDNDDGDHDDDYERKGSKGNEMGRIVITRSSVIAVTSVFLPSVFQAAGPPVRHEGVHGRAVGCY